MTRIIMLSLLTLTACGESPEETARKEADAAYWKNPVLVKICRDGTHIYKYSDGKYRTGGFGALVENPETVCVQ